MIRRNLVSCLALALSCWGAHVGAQEIAALEPVPPALEPTSCLDLGIAVETAMRATPEVRLGMAERDGMLASARDARAAGRPRLALTARTGLGDGVQADNQLDNRVGITASQLLFDFGAAGSARRAADSRVEGAEGELAAAQDELGQRAAMLYLELARREERLQVLEAQRDDYLRQAASAERRFARMLVRQSDMSLLLAELAQAEAALAGERLEIANLREMLGALLSRPIFCIAPRSITPWLARRWTGERGTALERARGHSGKLQAAQAEADASGYDLREVRQSRYPSIHATANVAEEYDRLSDRWRRFDRVGLDIRVPLYSGGELSARADAARARIAGARARLEREERDLTVRLNTAFNQVVWLEGIRRHQLAALESLSTRSAAVGREFEAGITTLTILTEARRDYSRAQLEEIDTRYQLIGQQVLVIALAGMLAE